MKLSLLTIVSFTVLDFFLLCFPMLCWLCPFCFFLGCIDTRQKANWNVSRSHIFYSLFQGGALKQEGAYYSSRHNAPTVIFVAGSKMKNCFLNEFNKAWESTKNPNSYSSWLLWHKRAGWHGQGQGRGRALVISKTRLQNDRQLAGRLICISICISVAITAHIWKKNVYMHSEKQKVLNQSRNGENA